MLEEEIKSENTPIKRSLSIQLTYIDKLNNDKILPINGNFWNYVDVLSKKMNINKLRGFFYQTMIISDKFKIKEVTNPFDYFRRCQFVAIIHGMALISGYFPYFNSSSGLIKIGPSKDLKKNCTIIDDSTVLDKDSNVIRDSNGELLEPHRGFKLYNSMNSLQQQDILFKLDSMLKELSNILFKIKKSEYEKFDPIDVLQKIAKHCNDNKYQSALNYLSMEVHDTPYLLTQDQRNNLFDDYDSLNNLWESGFITDNHGKFRIYIMCVYFLNSIEKNKMISK